MKQSLPFRAVDEGGVPGLVTHEHLPFFRFALDHIRESDRVLDVGAGDGTFARLCGADRTVQVESNPDSAGALGAEFDSVFEASLASLPFEDASFDVVHCSHVIEHLAPQELYDGLKEMDRVLAPGGRLILSYPLLWAGFYDDLSHVRPYGLGVVTAYLSEQESRNYSRNPISARYLLRSRKRRYARAEQAIFVVGNTGWWGKLLRKSLNVVARLMAGLGVCRLVLSGETIVLEKRA